MGVLAQEAASVLVPASKVLVLNAGSSSLKFKLFSLNPFLPGVGGMVERIGDEANSVLLAKREGESPQKWTEKVPVPDHTSAMMRIMDFLGQNVSGNIAREVRAVGHRLVHGLDIHKAVLLTPEVVDKVTLAATLAPLHNPPGLQGISAAQAVFGNAPQVGVFDTAFHQTMPMSSFMYGIPYDLYEKHHIRRYGFHGTSHKYLAETAAEMLGLPADELNAVTCHLGNGSSVTAIKKGLSIDTSMGLTPLEGLLMGTRSGDLDPAIVLHLQNAVGLSVKQVDTLLNKQSGLLGVCGVSDVRLVLERSAQGDARAQLALDMFVYRVQKYIGSYLAALGEQAHAIVFSAGIGENSPPVRKLVLEGLQHLGIELDQAKNLAAIGKQADISTPGSRIRILVIPTDEELSIAQQTVEVAAAAQAGAATAA